MTIIRPLAFIVEDDPQLGKIFSITLQKYFEIQLIADGRIALDGLVQEKPALVVLDLNLPGAHGRDVLSKIRADARLNQTRVILCTADTVQASFLDQEADVVLLKPISPNQLRDMALRVCGLQA